MTNILVYKFLHIHVGQAKSYFEQRGQPGVVTKESNQTFNVKRAQKLHCTFKIILELTLEFR